MATYSDHQQRMLDQGRSMEDVRQHRPRVTVPARSLSEEALRVLSGPMVVRRVHVRLEHTPARGGGHTRQYVARWVYRMSNGERWLQDRMALAVGATAADVMNRLAQLRRAADRY